MLLLERFELTTELRMSTFEIQTYTKTVPALQLDKEIGGRATTWMGHIGKDGEFMLKHAVQWALDSGISGDVQQAFENFFTYARKNYFLPSQDSVSITLRKVISSDNYEVPRPHHDGLYWRKDLNKGREVFKIGTALCGPGTLFWDTSDLDEETKKSVQQLVSNAARERAKQKGVEAEDTNIRKWATAELDRMGVQVVTLNNCQCVRWVVGDDEKAGIHSEPDMSNLTGGRVLQANFLILASSLQVMIVLLEYTKVYVLQCRFASRHGGTDSRSCSTMGGTFCCRRSYHEYTHGSCWSFVRL